VAAHQPARVLAAHLLAQFVPQQHLVLVHVCVLHDGAHRVRLRVVGQVVVHARRDVIDQVVNQRRALV